MAIEAGQGCGTISGAGNYTIISNAPASVSGSCTRLRAYVNSAGTSALKFAFFTRSGNAFTSQVVCPTSGSFSATGMGCHEFSAPTDFTAFSVTSGWYLGAYSPVIGYNTSGGLGYWYLSGDQTAASGPTFTADGDGKDMFEADISGAAPSYIFLKLCVDEISKCFGVATSSQLNGILVGA